MTETTLSFYDRRGTPKVPEAHSVVKNRIGAWIVAKAPDALLILWPWFTKGIADMPGGGVDADESLHEGAEREFYEETGLHFEPASDLISTHHQVRGFYAEDNNEFWIYDQTFFLYDYNRKQEIGEKWRNPEGDLVGWESWSKLSPLCINRAHWAALCAFYPDLNETGKTN